MIVLASVVAAAFTYFVLMRLMFEDAEEFVRKLRSTLFFFPIGAAFDLVSRNESLRIWFWVLSGPAVGLLIYRLLS